MADSIALARAVFAQFEKHYNKITSPTTDWTLAFQNEDEDELGLSKPQVDTALKVLLQKGLIRKRGVGRYSLADAGVEACLHASVLDEYLAPRRAASPAQNVTINAENMQNTQVGHHNTQNVTYSAVLESLREKVEASDATEEEKQGAKELIDKLLRHPLAATIVNLAVAGLSTGMR